jgi:hypothetical protein
MRFVYRLFYWIFRKLTVFSPCSEEERLSNWCQSGTHSSRSVKRSKWLLRFIAQVIDRCRVRIAVASSILSSARCIFRQNHAQSTVHCDSWKFVRPALDTALLANIVIIRKCSPTRICGIARHLPRLDLRNILYKTDLTNSRPTWRKHQWKHVFYNWSRRSICDFHAWNVSYGAVQ